MDDPDPAATLRAAYGEFHQLLAESAALIDAVSTAADRAAGYRHLGDLLSLGLDFYLTGGPADIPSFTRLITPNRQWSMASPDTVYERVPLDGSCTYRISGTRGTSVVLAFDIYRGMIGSTIDPRRQGARIADHQLIVDGDGRFEITISAAPHEGNWLALDPDMTELELGLMAKQYLFSTDVPATFAITCLERPGPARAPSASDVAERYRRVGYFVRDTLRYWEGIYQRWAQQPNCLVRLGVPDPTDDPNANSENAYLNGYWRLGEDEALVIRLSPAPVAQFWNFYICNRWWEGFDARRGRIYLNSGDLVADRDNSMRIVLAPRHSDCPNWLDTSGYGEGLMLLRMTRPEVIPNGQCEVVALREAVSLYGGPIPNQ